MTSWLKFKLGGRMRVSTVVLLVAFIALFWVYHNVEPARPPQSEPTPAVVPPGFVPDPNYTWVPRTQVRLPKEPLETTTTTTTTTTTAPTTTSPTDTTSPTSPTSPTPTTPTTTEPTPQGTVIDPDGPGPLGPITLPPAPTLPRPTPALTPPPS